MDMVAAAGGMATGPNADDESVHGRNQQLGQSNTGNGLTSQGTG